MLIKRYANYEFKEGEGHLYVFDKRNAHSDVGLIDLRALNVEGARARTTAQQAWLLGMLHRQGVPERCFAAHVRGPRSVFRDYAREEGIVVTNDLFPSSLEDPILRALLGLPWKKVKGSDDGGMIAFFRRALELPEYHESFVKIAPPSTAFFEGARVADFGPVDGVRGEHLVMSVSDIALFGIAHEPVMHFPKVLSLMAARPGLVFEIDELIQHANMNGEILYQKGIALMAHAPDLIELGELMVQHPGRTMSAAGMVRGWFYSVSDDGLWKRVEHPDQCPCRSERTHQSHLSALRIIEHLLVKSDGSGA
ncbi:hypothetical protein [Sphingomonas parapaucimobilis]|uniref:hypothetical protein n=1 Tax=Sphingomonas parapaucimobilis TaxID=28213 RepID=UPI003219FA7B